MANFDTLPAALLPMLQTGMLEREFEEGLDSVLAYRRIALQETVPTRIGETLTRTRVGRKEPNILPVNPANNTGLDNGMTPSDAALEQYLLSMLQYGDTADVDLLSDTATIANNLIRVARNNGVQAAQSMERIARKKLFAAYSGGNSYVRTDLGAGGTTTCFVDDITGFTQVLVNGVPTPVSSANPLTVYEYSVSSGVTQTLSVTAVAATATNNSQRPDGVSGEFTFGTKTTPVNGDALIAANAPQIIRPGGHITTAQMTGSDTLTLGYLLDAQTILQNNGVPTMPGGAYEVILDNQSRRQLWADQDFKLFFAGRDMSEEFRSGQIVSLLGLDIIPTTESYVQVAGKMMNGLDSKGNAQFTTSTATAAAAISTNVRRVIVSGAETMIQGNFEGVETWASRQGVNAISDIRLVNNVAHIFRPPLDRNQQNMSLTWLWIGDFAVPTDITATNLIIPTASNSLYKRSVIIETAG
jgi:hypothetical protein